MSKRDKNEVKKLRRKVEALKAELKSGSKGQEDSLPKLQQTSKTVGKATATEEVLDIRADLKRTALLTVISLTILATAFLTQNQWMSFIE